MRFPGFIGPSYTLQSVNVDCQRCVNLYPEMNELGTGKEREIASLVGTPGMRLLLTLPAGACRGVYAATNGELYAVGGNKLYSISSAWVATEIGTLNTSEGFVSMADNGTHLVCVDGAFGYTWNMETDAFAEITDEDFYPADQVTFQDGYFLFNKKGTKFFFIAGPNSVDFDGLDIAGAEGSPDDLIGLVSDQQNVFLFGDYSTEIFYNSGAADFPFVRHQGALINVGCAAAFSIQTLDKSVFWLGQDKNGKGIVYRTQGFQPQRISNHALESVIAGLGDVSKARAWVYQQRGHAFYALNLTGAQTTWVYDVSTQLWHERASIRYGEYTRHRADSHAFAHSTNVVGDFETGAIYALEDTQFTDNGSPIVRERTAPHFSQGGVRITHSHFELDLERGVGLTSGQGSAPQAMLQWSDDGGQTWSNEHWVSIGARGVRGPRAKWNRLGMARDRVYRVRISDPVKVTMLGADLGVEGGAA